VDRLTLLLRGIGYALSLSTANANTGRVHRGRGADVAGRVRSCPRSAACVADALVTPASCTRIGQRVPIYIAAQFPETRGFTISSRIPSTRRVTVSAADLAPESSVYVYVYTASSAAACRTKRQRDAWPHMHSAFRRRR